MSTVERPVATEEYRDVTEEVFATLAAPHRGYSAALAITGAICLVGVVAWGVQLGSGMGVTGLNHPVMWAVYITNFIWWLGIAHAGTLISAVLYLFRAPSRPAFSRPAEAMTLVALPIAALFPILHLGRAWRFYWLIPYPNDRLLWVNFQSLLTIEMIAVAVDLIVATLFLWLGLLPDVAILRDRSRGWRRTFFGLISLGWEGTLRQWRAHDRAYGLFAGLAMAAILAMHSIAAWDFSTTLLPGWHSTILAPYFVAVAMFSGMAMLLTLLIPLRAALSLKEYITLDRLEQIAKLVLFMSLIVTFTYLIEFFVTFYRGEPIEVISRLNKTAGALAPLFWATFFANALLPLCLFWRPARRNVAFLFALSLVVNVAMWLERFILVAGSLMRDYLPYSWQQGAYRLSLVEVGVTLGSLGGFLFGFLLFARIIPALPTAELKRHYLRMLREERALQEAAGRGAVA